MYRLRTYRNRCYLVVLFLAVMLVSCGGSPNRGVENALIENVPHVYSGSSHSNGFHGEACVEMVLKKLEHPGTWQWVFDHAGIPVTSGRVCGPDDLARAVKKIGFDPGPLWSMIKDKKWKKEIKGIWRALHTDLTRGIPSIVSIKKGSVNPVVQRRMILVTGFDQTKNQVIFHAPDTQNGAYLRMDLDTFLERWPVTSSPYTWRVFRLRMVPVELKKYREPDGFTRAEYARHYMELKEKIPGPQFAVVLQEPFFVIGNQPRQMLDQVWAKGTILWTISRLKALYFKKDPNDILDIWLFKDKSSYEKYTKQIWNQEPGTPFGYYSSYHKALVMNIATGGGTLVHEIVHPFMESNFPQCPDWFNEGMGSLYEQSGERDGKIVGLTNWRLRGLQEAIVNNQLPSFKEMTHDPDFYNQPNGYAQARYLCYYLQDKGLLVKYYRQFKKNHKTDPTGCNTLIKILNNPDMNTFQKNWESYILKLKFPPST